MDFRKFAPSPWYELPRSVPVVFCFFSFDFAYGYCVYLAGWLVEVHPAFTHETFYFLLDDTTQ